METERLARTEKRKRKRVNGHNVRIKNAASARNARGKKVIIQHGGSSDHLRFGELDNRTRLAKAQKKLIKALERDHAPNPSAMQSAIFRSFVRMDIIGTIGMDELLRSGITPGTIEAIIKIARELLAVIESDAFAAVRPDMDMVRLAQAQALKEMSDAALHALSWHRYGGPEPAPAKPLLLLAPPKVVRPRIEPRQPRPTPAPAPPALVIVDPQSREAKAARARAAASEGGGGVTGRWDAPWNLR